MPHLETVSLQREPNYNELIRVNPNPIGLCPDKRGKFGHGQTHTGDDGEDGGLQGCVCEPKHTYDCRQHWNLGRGRKGPEALQVSEVVGSSRHLDFVSLLLLFFGCVGSSLLRAGFL